ncbi:ParA family protein [Dermabacteraceae bacterium P13115]
MIAGPGRENRLKEALATVADDYDLIFIDCAPSIDQLTINAFMAADAVVIVTHTKLFSSNGLSRLLETIESVRAYYNPTLSVAGILVNQHEARTVSGAARLEELEGITQEIEVPLLSPPAPRRVVIADASEASCGLDE